MKYIEENYLRTLLSKVFVTQKNTSHVFTQIQKKPWILNPLYINLALCEI